MGAMRRLVQTIAGAVRAHTAFRLPEPVVRVADLLPAQIPGLESIRADVRVSVWVTHTYTHNQASMRSDPVELPPWT